MTELDRILSRVETPTISRDFCDRVMSGVRQEAAIAGPPRSGALLPAALLLVLVGGPLGLLTAAGARALSAGADGGAAGALWLVAVLVVTSIGALLPLQLMES